MALRDIRGKHNVSQLWKLAKNFAHEAALIGATQRQDKNPGTGVKLSNRIASLYGWNGDWDLIKHKQKPGGHDSLLRPRLIGRLIAATGEEYSKDILKSAADSIIDLGNSIIDLPGSEIFSQSQFYKVLDQMIRGYIDVIISPEIAKSDEIFDAKHNNIVDNQQIDNTILESLKRLFNDNHVISKPLATLIDMILKKLREENHQSSEPPVDWKGLAK